jgi:hypothetical protein
MGEERVRARRGARTPSNIGSFAPPSAPWRMQKSPALTNPAVWPLPQRQPERRSRILVQLKAAGQQNPQDARYYPSPRMIETVGGIRLAMSSVEGAYGIVKQ